uniref:Protein E7 n=1 Tax=Rousettus bat papillomavirus TaxID=3141903 RepID=A0AAU7E2W1_9PAPI
MIGGQPNLAAVAGAESAPDAVSLRCEEQLPSEEELEAEFGVPYSILLACMICDKGLRLTLVCCGGGLRRLQELLLGDVKVVCRDCSAQHFRHGR